MRKFSILWVSVLSLLIGGCSTVRYQTSEPKMIVLKTPKLKFADTGYLRKDDKSVELEIFEAGMAVEKISIAKEVCVSAGCMDEAKFVKEYLYESYPSDTMRRVLRGEDIFNGQGKEELCSGTLYQFIRNDDIDIIYRRKASETFFKDRLNGLMIKITDLKDLNATE